MKRARLTLLLGTEIPILGFLAFAILPWFWIRAVCGRNERLQRLIGKLARRTFDGNLGVRLQVKLPTHSGE